MEAIDDHDDVQNVFANFDVPEKISRRTRSRVAGIGVGGGRGGGNAARGWSVLHMLTSLV